MDRERTIAEIGRLTEGPPCVLPRDKLRAWMNSGDVEIQGAVYVLLRDARHKVTVAPLLRGDEYEPFYRGYLERVIREGSSSLTRHGAGYEIVKWMTSLSDDASTPKSALQGIRDWLASIYLNGSSEERQVLINGVLEHLFERQDIRKLFSDWKRDPVLREAIADASLWVRRGGRSPLTGNRESVRIRRRRRGGRKH